jgi:MFS transporter, DHA1 family, tetracycline resistance protein
VRQVPKNLKLILPFFTVIVLDAMGTGMMLPVLAPLVNAKHGILSAYSKVEQHLIYGIILGMWPFCFMIGAPIFGCLSDYWGRKRILLTCLAGSLLSFLLYIASFRFTLLGALLIGRVIGGITSGSQGVAQAAIAEASAGNQKAVNIGVIAVAMTIGLIVGPLLGGVFSDKNVVSWFNNTTPFYIAALLTLVNIMLLTRYLKNKTTHAQQHQLLARLAKIARNHRLLILLLAFFFFELGWSLYFQSLALLLAQHFHFSNAMIGVFSSYIGLVLSLSLLILVRAILKFWPMQQSIYYGLCLGLASLLLVYFLPGISAQWILAVTIAIAVAICYSGMIASASDLMDEGQGLLMGITDAILALAFSITGFLSGITAYHNPHFPQLISAIFMLVAVLIFRYNYRRSS